jgi:hypothetical protein
METIKVHVIDYGRKFLYLRYRDPITGEQSAKSSECTTEAAALKAAGKWEDELREGRYKPASKVTWCEFRQRHEDEVLAGLRPATEAKNSGVLRCVEEILNPARAADITASRISHLQKVLRERGLAEFTIRGHLSVIRAVLNWEHRVGIVNSVPRIDMPKRAKGASMSKGRPITGEEFDRMLAAVPAVFRVLGECRSDGRPALRGRRRDFGSG